MLKKRSLVLVALVLFTVSLFAAPVVVTWEWMLEDPNVTTFRYQIDGEDPEGWIVVDASMTSYTVKGLDGTQAYTLFLQQSYDGVNFSGSAKAVSEPMLPTEPEAVVASAEPVAEEMASPAVVAEEMVVAEEIVVAEDMVVADAEPVAEDMVVADAEPVAEDMVVADAEPEAEDMVVADAEPEVEAEPVAEAVVTPVVVTEEKAKAASRFKTTITLGGRFSHAYDVFSNATPTLQTKNLQAELGLQFKNMMTFNKAFGLGMDVGIAYTPYLSTSRAWGDAFKDLFSDFSGLMSDFTQAGTLSVGPMLNMQLGKVAVDLGGGGFITYGPDFKSTKGEAFMYGAFAKLGMAYQINNWFSIGLDAKYNFVLVDFQDINKFAEAGIYMGFSF